MHPNVFEVRDFEDLNIENINLFIKYARKISPQLADELSKTLNSDPQLLSALMQTITQIVRDVPISFNSHARQMFRQYATDDKAVEAICAQFGLTRQVIKKGDPYANPKIPDTMETNEQLLRRYDLAPYGLHTTGTRHGYKHHALSLGQRPVITTEAFPNFIVATYDYSDTDYNVLVKDADCKMKEKYSGKVELAILRYVDTRLSDPYGSDSGIAGNDLIKQVSDYMNRDDIAQKTDELTVKSAVIKPYKINANIYTAGDPNFSVSEKFALEALKEYVEKSHRLGQRITVGEIYAVLYDTKPQRIELISPAADIICEWDEAPFCEDIILNVKE